MTYDSDFESRFFPDDPPLIRAYGGPSESLFLERRKQAKELKALLADLAMKMNTLECIVSGLKYRRKLYSDRQAWRQFRNHIRGEVRRNLQVLKTEMLNRAMEFVEQAK